MEELLQELIEFVKNASPVLWEILYRQVYVVVVQEAIWAVILGITTIGLAKLAKYGYKEAQKESYSMWEVATVFSVTFGIASGITSLLLFTGVISMLINPQYYAINLILSSLGQ